MASNAGGAVGDNLAALLVERLSMTLFDVVKLFAVAHVACLSSSCLVTYHFIGKASCICPGPRR
jgi:hypothetical protein